MESNEQQVTANQVSDTQSVALNTSTDNTAQPSVSFSAQDAWKTNFAPELRSGIDRFKDPESLAKAYMGAVDLISKKVSDFSSEDVGRYGEMIEHLRDIPADPKGYSIDVSEIDGRQNLMSDQDVEDLKALSKDMGLNRNQSQYLYDALNGMANNIIADRVEEIKGAEQQVMSDLARDWGKAFEHKKASLGICVNDVIPKLTGASPDAVSASFQAAVMAGGSIVAKTLAAFGEMCSNSQSSGYNNIAPMDAKLQFEHFKKDKTNEQAMMDPRHPRHKQATEEFRRLAKLSE